jgi:hypothetical protein
MGLLYQTQGTAEVKRWLGLARDQARDPRPALKDSAEEMLARTQRRMRAGVDVHGRPFTRSRGGAGRGGQTLWDRGVLAASAQYSVTRDAFDLFSSDKRARVLQEGETITPKNSQFLTIPIRARGGMFGQRDVAAIGNRTGTRARHYKNTFFLRRGERLLLMQKTPGGALRALFLLVRSVKLPRREWLGFNSADLDMVAGKLGSHISGDKR